MARHGKVEATVTVKNTGQRAGETVVQLYIQDVAASAVHGQVHPDLTNPTQRKENKFRLIGICHLYS